MGTRLFITGATGFIGANLCAYFSSRGYSVIANEGAQGPSWRLDALRVPVKRVRVDLTSKEQVQRLLSAEKPQGILHCAAYGAYPIQNDAERIYRVNLDATRYLLEVASTLSSLEFLLHMGSSSEYGLNCRGPLESDALAPDSHYAISKSAASHLVQYFGKKLNVPVWSMRLYSVYGAFEEPSRLIPQLILQGQAKKFPPFVNPDISRDFLHVEDMAAACERVIALRAKLNRGEIYNIGSGVCTSIRTLAGVAKQLFKIQEEPSWGTMPNRSWDNKDWFANVEKAKRELGWAAAIPLLQGLMQTAEWYGQNPAIVQTAQLNSVLSRVVREAA